MNLSEKVDRIHSRSVLLVQPSRGRSIAGPDTMLGPSRAGNERPQATNGSRHATRGAQVKRPGEPTTWASGHQQTFVSMSDGGPKRLDLTTGVATRPQDGNYGVGHGTNSGPAISRLSKPELKLFERYQFALTPLENSNSTGAEDVTADELRVLVSKVVEVETPVHILDLRWEIRECLGVYGDTETLSIQVDAAIQALVSNRIIRRELADGSHSGNGPFLTIQGFDKDVKPRCGGTRNGRGDISRISNAELRQDLLTVMWAMYTASPSSLMIETARQFGFVRTDVKLSQRINSSIDQLLKEGKISAADGGMLHGG